MIYQSFIYCALCENKKHINLILGGCVLSMIGDGIYFKKNNVTEGSDFWKRLNFGKGYVLDPYSYHEM